MESSLSRPREDGTGRGGPTKHGESRTGTVTPEESQGSHPNLTYKQVNRGKSMVDYKGVPRVRLLLKVIRTNSVHPPESNRVN